MMILVAIILTAVTAYTLTGVIINLTNNKGNSKASIGDISEQGLVLLAKEDSRSKRYSLRQYEQRNPVKPAEVGDGDW